MNKFSRWKLTLQTWTFRIAVIISKSIHFAINSQLNLPGSQRGRISTKTILAMTSYLDFKSKLLNQALEPSFKDNIYKKWFRLNLEKKLQLDLFLIKSFNHLFCLNIINKTDSERERKKLSFCLLKIVRKLNLNLLIIHKKIIEKGRKRKYIIITICFIKYQLLENIFLFNISSSLSFNKFVFKNDFHLNRFNKNTYIFFSFKDNKNLFWIIWCIVKKLKWNLIKKLINKFYYFSCFIRVKPRLERFELDY